MTPNADDLAKNLAALTERFAGLAAKLIKAAQELQTSGTLPAEALLEELAAARDARRGAAARPRGPGPGHDHQPRGRPELRRVARGPGKGAGDPRRGARPE